MDLFLQQVFNGIMLGSTYAIVALGLTLVFGILNIPNFAHGHLYMLGAYTCFSLITMVGIGFWTALLLSTLALGLIGMVVERLVYRPLKDQPHINSFISAIGALMILENGVMAISGVLRDSVFPTLTPDPLEILGITMTQQRLLLIVVTLVLILAAAIVYQENHHGEHHRGRGPGPGRGSCWSGSASTGYLP